MRARRLMPELHKAQQKLIKCEMFRRPPKISKKTVDIYFQMNIICNESVSKLTYFYGNKIRPHTVSGSDSGR